jgi:hypothetical protein
MVSLVGGELATASGACQSGHDDKVRCHFSKTFEDLGLIFY